MKRRKFLRFGGLGVLLGCAKVAVASTPKWIQKRRKVFISNLVAGGSHITSLSFQAAPGDYATLDSNAGRYGLVATVAIDADGQVIITTYNPKSESVSASLEYTVRLHKI